jgi:hypothetical protein
MAGYGCSVRYADVANHDTLIGFPPRLNDVETATGSNDRITWRRLRRTGIGLDVSKQSFGLMIGYEHVFLLWVEGDGAWDMFYSPEKGMSITELKIPADPESEAAGSDVDSADSRKDRVKP